MNKLTTLLTLTALSLGVADSAQAWEGHGRHEGWHGDRGHHHGHDRHHSSFGLNIFSYSTPYYRHTTYYGPQPVIVSRPIYVQQLQPVVNYAENDRYCREYQSVSRVGGRSQSSYGRACLQPDGSWEIVN